MVNSDILNLNRRTHGESEEISMMNILITAVIVLWLTLREKEIKTTRLWLLPAILAYGVFSSISQTALSLNSILLYILCFVIGCGIGVWRSYLEQIRIHPETGKMMSKGSLARTRTWYKLKVRLKEPSSILRIGGGFFVIIVL
jgi:hypothetical protein